MAFRKPSAPSAARLWARLHIDVRSVQPHAPRGAGIRVHAGVQLPGMLIGLLSHQLVVAQGVPVGSVRCGYDGQATPGGGMVLRGFSHVHYLDGDG